MRLSEAFNEYRRMGIQAKGCSLKTDESAKYAGKVACQYFGDIRINKIGPNEVNEFYLDLTTNSARRTGSGRVVSRNTARSYVMILRAVISYCYSKGMHVCNPSSIIVPKREKKCARFIELDQYEKLLRVASERKRGYAEINRVRNTLIIKMLFYTGLRVGELCALNRDTIRNRQFTVVGKSKDPRPCFITKEIEQDIRAYLAMRSDDNPALFLSNETGERITTGNVQRIFKRIGADAGLYRVTPHTMRHSFATRLIDDKVDIRFVAALLGHQDLNTTKQYTHVKYYKLREIYQNALENS